MRPPDSRLLKKVRIRRPRHVPCGALLHQVAARCNRCLDVGRGSGRRGICRAANNLRLRQVAEDFDGEVGSVCLTKIEQGPVLRNQSSSVSAILTRIPNGTGPVSCQNVSSGFAGLVRSGVLTGYLTAIASSHRAAKVRGSYRDDAVGLGRAGTKEAAVGANMA